MPVFHLNRDNRGLVNNFWFDIVKLLEEVWYDRIIKYLLHKSCQNFTDNEEFVVRVRINQGSGVPLRSSLIPLLFLLFFRNSQQFPLRIMNLSLNCQDPKEKRLEQTMQVDK